MQTKETQNDLRNSLTNLESILYALWMRLRELVRSVGIQAGRDDSDLRRLMQERDRLRPSYLRFQEVEESIVQKSERLGLLYSLMLSVPLTVREGDAFSGSKRPQRVEESEPLLAEIRNLSDFPLWKIMKEIVRQVPRTQIISLEHMLKALGVVVSRAAIESALETHKEEFDVTRQGRKKFVALKGVQKDASSTNNDRK